MGSSRFIPGRVKALVVLASLAAACGGESTEADSEPAKGVSEIVLIAEKTDRVAGVIPKDMRGKAKALAEKGAGTLRVFAVGRTASEVGFIDLRITRAGTDQEEHSPPLRAIGVDDRLTDLSEAIAKAQVGSIGFDLYAALQAAEDISKGGRADVTLATAVLTATVAPLDMSVLTAGDPEAAVQEVMKTDISEVDLSGVDLHPVLLTPGGSGQEPLGVASEVWREKFIVGLGQALGARVSEPVRDRERAAPWADPSAVPPIVQIEPEPTPTPDPPRVGRIDAAYFRPDEAVLIDPAAVESKAAQIAGQYLEAPAGSVMTVTGFCAKFGDNPAGARALSKRRAEVIRDLLVDAGVPPEFVRADGKGWDVKGTPGKPAQDRAQRVVVVKITAPETT
ncbi:hypothetical protein Acor_60250 [Acrocarpospora corrugata]|uniref:OmpA-like domain-containing protein n=1 Tax=Acrocarpospora corrugata TaxID=35763 RepID=A0A5M3W6L2_9ACTN|nr:OmpA family protein [Acrocarpospora corrugata]GES03959.1 hypothetical protein Acor_60250 [Acrocarpospora corrugata]